MHYDASAQDAEFELLKAFADKYSLGFKGNADRLHRIIVDDFINSMDYLLMVGSEQLRLAL